MVMPDLFRLPMPTDAALQKSLARMVNALSILAIPFLLTFSRSALPRAGSRFMTSSWKGQRSLQRHFANHSVSGDDAGSDWNVQGRGRNRSVDEIAQPDPDSIAFFQPIWCRSLDAAIERERDLALTDVVHRFGPDNIISLMAATIYGSTETTFYVVAVYFDRSGSNRHGTRFQRDCWPI
jgi:hypothetical protein